MCHLRLCCPDDRLIQDHQGRLGLICQKGAGMSHHVSSVLVHLGCYHKIPQTGQLRNDRNFFHSSGGWKSKVMASVWLGESPVWGSEMMILLCPHGVGGARGSLWSLFYKPLISFMRAPLHDFGTSRRPHHLLPTSLCLGISIYKFWGDTFRPQHLLFLDSFFTTLSLPRTKEIPQQTHSFVLFINGNY